MKNKTSYRGHVEDGGVVLHERTSLPDGTEVLVVPLDPAPGSPAAVLAAVKRLRGIKSEDVDDLMSFVKEGRHPANYRDPLRPRRGR